MSGHAILDSCHNCGAQHVELFLVDSSKTSTSCQEPKGDKQPYHHIHVFVACASCKKAIWEKE